MAYLHVCTHLYMVRAGPCWKYEHCNWGNASGDNLWSDSAILGVWGGSITEGQVVKNASCVNHYILMGLFFLVGGNSHLYLIYVFILLWLKSVFISTVYTKIFDILVSFCVTKLLLFINCHYSLSSLMVFAQ